MDDLSTEMLEIIGDIIDILPDDYAEAMTCLTVSISAYSAIKGYDQMDTWKSVYQTVQSVHNELEDMEV